MSADCETNPISPLFSVCRYTEGFERSEWRGSAQVCELLPRGGCRLCAACPMQQRSREGGFIESNGGKMFEHLQHMDSIVSG